MRNIFFVAMLALVSSSAFTQEGDLPPAQEMQDEMQSESTGGFDQAALQANQAFNQLRQRQFRAALQLYEQAASTDDNYTKMVDFVQSILDRIKELEEEWQDIFGEAQQPEFRMESVDKEKIDRMLEFQFKQYAGGQSLGELGMIGNIPLTDLGLDFEGAENMVLAEYLGWISPRSANERIWDRIRRHSLRRQLTYAKLEIYQQQRQERIQRVEDLRRRKLERQGGQIGGGFTGGGGFGGGMGGGMGGGFGGGMGGMGGGFGGGMGGF